MKKIRGENDDQNKGYKPFVRQYWLKKYLLAIFSGTLLGVVFGDLIVDTFHGTIRYCVEWAIYLYVSQDYGYSSVSTGFIDKVTRSTSFVLRLCISGFFISRMCEAYELYSDLVERKLKHRFLFFKYAHRFFVPYNEAADIIWAVYTSFSRELIMPVVGIPSAAIIFFLLADYPIIIRLLSALIAAMFLVEVVERVNHLLTGTYFLDKEIENAPDFIAVLDQVENQKRLEETEDLALKEFVLDIEGEEHDDMDS